MSAKVILVVCAHALFLQNAFSLCHGRGAIGTPALIAPGCAGNGLIGNGYGGIFANNGVYGDGIIGNGLYGNGLAALEIIPTSGGGLPVSSISAFAPSILSVASENVYEGALFVAGELPFVSAVALESVLPSAGTGAVSYSCGNGITAIESIAPSAAIYGTVGTYGLGAGYGPGAATLGLGYGSHGCGRGVY